MNDEVFEESSTPVDFNKRYALILLFALITFAHLPSLILRNVWVEDGRSKNDFVVCVFLPCLQLYLMLLCPITLARIKHVVAIHDYIWCRCTRAEILSFPFLVIGMLLVIIVVYKLDRIIHPAQSAAFLFYSNHGTTFLVWMVMRRTLLSPVIEEFFWRGYVQGTLTRVSRPWFAILGQSLLFGLAHFTLFVDTVRTCLIGFVFGVWRHKRKTLLPVIIMHVVNNFTYFAIRWPDQLETFTIAIKQYQTVVAVEQSPHPKLSCTRTKLTFFARPRHCSVARILDISSVSPKHTSENEMRIYSSITDSFVPNDVLFYSPAAHHI